MLIGGDTVVHTIRSHAASRADDIALVFSKAEGHEEVLTYGELDRRARAFALRLTARAGPGDPVLLMMRSDAASVTALVACLYAGVLCAPVPIPARNGNTDRLRSIAAASGAVAVIAPADASALASVLPALVWLSVDEAADSRDWAPSGTHGSSSAIVQYTSGSTGMPKGVLLTHANILANLEMLRHAFHVDDTSRFASWLPLFHDMGLAMLLMPLHFGVPGVLMPPLAFLRRPLRWLQAVDRHGATITGAPNFAYEACVGRIADADRAGLDLSRLTLAFCGAEPVRRATMRRFAERFAPNGFRAATLYPCYGMAEAVCFVSGGFLPTDADPASPVGCGSPGIGSTIAIVDPRTGDACEDGESGEIWVHGPHVGAGYLGLREATRATFGATLPNRVAHAYLRTGDLGFLRGGELTITGRLKDIIIHRGTNLHAADIEATVAACHPEFGAVGAAFPWEVDGTEHVVVVQEVARGRETADEAVLHAAALDAVARQHGVRLHDLVLVRAGRIPKTSSGKVRREACRTLYADGTFRSESGATP